MNVVVRETL